jgi:hypothetical protein
MTEGSSTAAATDGRSDRVLLVGVARSGTSWLGLGMSKAPGVRYYYEPDWFDADLGARAGTWGYGPYPMIDAGQDDNPFTPVWDMVFSGRYPFMRGGEKSRLRPAAKLALRIPKGIRNPLTRQAARLSLRVPSNRKRTIVKTVGALFSLDWLIARYSPSVVAIQRNPLNVVSSWRELKIQLFDLATRPAVHERYLRPLGIEPPAPDTTEIGRIAWHVGLLTHVVGEAVDRHPHWPVVTHEDLCTEPVAAFREVFNRVGLQWTEEVERFLAASNRPGEGKRPVRLTTEQPQRWRERLSADEVRDIARVLERFPRRGWIVAPTTAALDAAPV